MSALAGLLGVLVGGSITALVQLRIRQSEKRERWLGDLLQSCAEVYALESTFRGQATRSARDGDSAGLEAWPRMERRIAEAKIMLLTTDEPLVAALDHIGTIGRKAYHAAHQRTDEYPALIDMHRDALLRFAEASQHALRAEKVI